MLDYIIDSLVVVVFICLARMLWIFSKKKRTPHIKLLLQTISLFILLHLVLFPIIYVYIINKNTGSILIDENIITYERNTKLEEAKKILTEIDSISNSEEQRFIINKILDTNQEYLKTVDWKNIDNTRIIFLDSNLISGYTQYRIIPDDVVHKILIIYDLKGEKLIEFQTMSKKEKISEILIDHIKELDSEKDDIKEKIKIIEANAFWNYRQILPYTLNILFTDNFKPQSRKANIIYFIHNILVIGFLLALIVNLFQHYLLNNKD